MTHVTPQTDKSNALPRVRTPQDGLLLRSSTSRGEGDQGRATEDVWHVLEGRADCMGQIPVLDSVCYLGFVVLQ